MKKKPTIEEIEKAYMAYHDAQVGCDRCPLQQRRIKEGGCMSLFCYLVLTGKLNLDGTPVADKEKVTECKFGNMKDTLKTFENAGQAKPLLGALSYVSTPNPNIPKWVKLCAWVLTNDNKYGKIIALRDQGLLIYFADKSGTKFYQPCDLKPVRFRKYTFEEAKNLLGKVVEFTDERGHKIAQLVTNVFKNAVNGELAINGTIYPIFKKNTTIDNLPFGVPEVDTEAMKEETK